MKFTILYSLLLLCFYSTVSYGQLPAFTFTLTATDETCPQNGTLNFQVSGTDPGAVIIYTIYKLPVTATPFTTVTSNSLTGLRAATYRIVATQTLGSLTNSQTSEITIADRKADLVFSMAGSGAICSDGSVITVNVTQGNPVGYELFNGPITRPIQTSPIFSNLPAGNYTVRVHDVCSNAVSRSFTLAVPDYSATGIIPQATEFPKPELPTCDSIVIGHRLSISPQYYLSYPFTFQFTVYPPGGGTPIVTSSVINGTSGRHAGGYLPQSVPFEFTIPYYPSSYTYDLLITDACGKTYTRNAYLVNKQMAAIIATKTLTCGQKGLKLSGTNYVSPLHVEFLSSPSTFVASSYNASHPDFNEFPEYGAINNAVPDGLYRVQVTDACGRSAISQIQVLTEPKATATATNTCQDGASIKVKSEGASIVSIFITQAPGPPISFPFPLPFNAEAYITAEGTVEISGILVPGNYILSVTDSCSNTYALPVNVPSPGRVAPTLVPRYAGGCDAGFGSVYFGHPDITLQSVTFLSGPDITAALNVSENIRGTFFMMSSLRAGTYRAIVNIECSNSQILTLQIPEYIGNTTVNVIEGCSSFDMEFSHTNNNTTNNLGYWLQKRRPNGSWGHPTTGVVYSNPAISPNSINSLPVVNNSLNTNLGNEGNYRLMTASTIYSSVGSSSTCVRVLHEFSIGGPPVINSVTTFSCSGNLSAAFVDVRGIGPFIYQIKEKNSLPFEIDNGNDPMFSNLETGIYRFQVQDACGNIESIIYEISEPFEFTPIAYLCEGEYGEIVVPQFDYLQYVWYKEGEETNILSTTNILPFNPVNIATDAGVYFVSITYPFTMTSCLNQLIRYEVKPDIFSPRAGNDNYVSLCTIPPIIDLRDYLAGDFQTGGIIYFTGSGSINLSSSGIWNLAGITPGIYTFIYWIMGDCGTTDEAAITVEFTNLISKPILTAIDPLCVGEPVSLSVTNVNLLYTYSWTGPNGFTASGFSPVFPNATIDMAGDYTVTASLGQSSCPSEATVVTLVINPLPEFHFTNQAVEICANQSAMLSLDGDNFDVNLADFTWYHDGNEIPSVSISEIEVNQPGIYKAVAIYNGCSSEEEFRVVLNTDVFFVDTKVGCENDLYMLSAFAVNDSFDESTATYEWTGPNGFTSTQQFVDVSGLDSGDYKIVVTNDSGCNSDDTIYVRKAYCKIPKGVSPNGDLNNDTWSLAGMDIEKVKIFNRHGAEVFEQNDYIDHWHGQAKNGNMLPNATYYYHIKFRSGHEKTGWVYLNREVN